MVTDAIQFVRAVPTTKRWTHRQVGTVYVDFEIVNGYDLHDAERGRLPEPGVRRVTLTNVLVDTGATHLCLPADLIAHLGLSLLKEIVVDTPAGTTTARLFDGARVTIGDRSGMFTCVELPEGRQALLGVVVMETLGLQPDIREHRLVFLPETGPGTHILAY